MPVLPYAATAIARILRGWPWLTVFVCLTGLSSGDRVQAASPPAAVAPGDAGLTPVVSTVELADPLFPTRPAVPQRVIQYRDKNGFPAGYALRVATEVCIDKKCQPVEVTLYWNALGYYERLECPPGKPLTKKEHVPFAVADYAKLDLILKDRDSILARQSLAFLAKPVENFKGIDALSGATPLTMRESVVENAAYTTWVLWHWANGETAGKLRGLTEQSCTPPYLHHLLRSEDRRCIDFALKYVLDHHPADAQFLEDVLLVMEHGDREHILLALRFVSRAMKDKEQRQARLIAAYGRMKSTSAPLVLDHLAAERDLPRKTLEGLTAGLDRLPYFQMHLILRLLEEKKFCSPQTEADVARLLAGNDFFKARRACEYLLKQKLGSETEVKVQAFRERYRDRL